MTAPSVAPSSAAPPSAEPTTSASVEPTASSAAGQELHVVGQDFAFELPASIPAGPTQVTLKNSGKEEHQAQVARINTGTSMADLTAALQNPDPSGALALISGHPRLAAIDAADRRRGAPDTQNDPGRMTRVVGSSSGSERD